MYSRCPRAHQGRPLPHLSSAGQQVVAWVYEWEQGWHEYPWPGGRDGQPTWWVALANTARDELAMIRKQQHDRDMEKLKNGRKS